jgi:hypothetical protein
VYHNGHTLMVVTIPHQFETLKCYDTLDNMTFHGSMFIVALHSPTLSFLRASSRITRPIHRALNMSRNAVLTSIELTPNHTIFAEGTSDSLGN